MRRNEPTIVFGTHSSGVANRVSGTQSFLDAVGASAPSADQTAFMARVQAVCTDWRNRALLSQAEQTAVVSAAQAAEPDLRP